MREMSSETRREWLVVFCLTLAFFALLWVPFEMIYKAIEAYGQGAKNAAGEVAARTKFIWPSLVGFFLAGAFLSYRGRDRLRWVVPPLITLTLLIAIASAASYVVAIISLFLTHTPVVLLLWFWIVYRTGLFLLRRFFSDRIELSGSLIERAAVYSVLSIPQTLCQFGLFLNLEWYFSGWI